MTRPAIPSRPLLAICLALIAISGGPISALPQKAKTATSEKKDRPAETSTAKESATEEEAESGETRDAESTRPDDNPIAYRDPRAKTTEAGQKNVSPLVKAARSAATKKSSRRFTDADLGRAKGHMIVIEGTNVREPEIVPIEDRTPEVVEAKAQNVAAMERAVYRKSEITRLQKAIEETETELRQLELDYYEVDEEDHYEFVARQFAEKRKALEELKKKLSDLQSGGTGGE